MNRLLYHSFCLLLLGLLISPLAAQETKASEPEDLRLERTYSRKAVLPLFVNFGNLDAKVLSLISKESATGRLDAHNIESFLIQSNFEREAYMEEGELSSLGNAQNKFTNFRNSLNRVSGGQTKDTLTPAKVVNEAELSRLYNELLMQEKIGNQILATWFDRSETGAFSVAGTFSSRAQYSASYLDKINAITTVRGISSISDHADQLVNQTYVLVGDIASVKSMDQIYREQETDAKNRTKTGYQASGKLHVFRLDFGDSIQSIFWNDLWIQGNEDPETIAARKQAFDEMNFPFVYVQTLGLGGSGTKDRRRPQNKILALAWDAQSDADLFETCIKGVSTGLASAFVDQNTQAGKGLLSSKTNSQENSLVPDLTLKGNIVSSDPISVRLGKKEGLRRDQYFYLMEDKGNQKKSVSKRVGLLRVHTVGNNADESLDSDSTTFYQLHGPAPYQGMFIVERRGRGIAVGLGTERSLRGGMAGPTLRIDLPIGRVTQGPYPGLMGVYLSGTADVSKRGRPEIDSTQTFFAENTFLNYQVTKGENTASFGRLGIGLLYEQYFGRRFHYLANVGYAQEWTSSLEGAIYNVSLQQSMADIGIRAGVGLLPNVQLQLGLHSRLAIGAPSIVWQDRNGEDRESWKLNASYGEVFTGRGATVSASLGLRLLL